MTVLRAPTALDFPGMLALNNAHHVEVGKIPPEGLRKLAETAFHVRVVGSIDALFVGFEQGADYNSPNYLWFAERFPRFAYIDRVVVAEAARGRGLARLLYEDFFHASKARGHSQVCCEVNYDPPNAGSDAFHASMGFEEIGRATLPDRGKSVRYLLRAI
jgi:predicted GNAT superfamily acetyltransferase